MSKIKESEKRFAGAPWFNTIKSYSIHIIGLGTIGSWTALNIARLNPNSINIFDGDILEEANLAGQLYPSFDIGSFKYDALQNIINVFAPDVQVRKNHYVYPNTSFFLNSNTSNIIITGVDSMNARKSIWENIQTVQVLPENSDKDYWLIDGRMSAEGLQIITINLKDKEEVKYYEENWLYDSSVVTRGDVCSYKQTSFIGSLIGGLMANIVVNIATNYKEPDMRTIPKVLQYTAEDMIFDLNLTNNADTTKE